MINTALLSSSQTDLSLIPISTAVFLQHRSFPNPAGLSRSNFWDFPGVLNQEYFETTPNGNFRLCLAAVIRKLLISIKIQTLYGKTYDFKSCFSFSEVFKESVQNSRYFQEFQKACELCNITSSTVVTTTANNTVVS